MALQHVHVLKPQRRYYRIYGPYISAFTMNKHIAKLQKRTKPHWKQLPSQVIQDVVLQIDKGYQKFFQNQKDRKAILKTRRIGTPHIKPKHKYNSLNFTQAGYKIEDNRIYIGCLKKWFTFWKHRDWTEHIKTVTLKRDNVSEDYLFLSCEGTKPSEQLPKTGNRAGIDSD